MNRWTYVRCGLVLATLLLGLCVAPAAKANCGDYVVVGGYVDMGHMRNSHTQQVDKGDPSVGSREARLGSSSRDARLPSPCTGPSCSSAPVSIPRTLVRMSPPPTDAAFLGSRDLWLFSESFFSLDDGAHPHPVHGSFLIERPPCA